MNVHECMYVYMQACLDVHVTSRCAGLSEPLLSVRA